MTNSADHDPLSNGNHSRPDSATPAAKPDDEGGLHAPPGLSPWRRFWWWFDFVILVKVARLRFIVILLAIGAVIAYWDTLKAYYEKWTRPAAITAEASSDTEFWCPMHPSVVRDKPGKCPVCGMPLSKRHKGETNADEPLPAGVVARVQFTPYRVALAGIQTSPVGYRTLTKEIRTVGFVEFDERKLQRITDRITGKSRIDKLYVNVTGQMVHEGDPLAMLYAPDLVVTLQNLFDAGRSGQQELERITRERLRLWGIDDGQVAEMLKADRPVTHVTIRSPMTGHLIKKYQVEGEYVDEGARLFDLADLSTVWIEAQVYEDELAFLREGLEITATTKAYPSRVFRGRIAFVHPHLDSSTRTLRVRFDMENARHELRPGMYANVKLEVPTTTLDLFAMRANDTWRDRLVAEGIGHALAGSSGTFGISTLVQTAFDRTIRKEGLVLAVPESSVIDTGSRKIVYRELEPGLYEGQLVEIGPRSDGFYPVLAGLMPGDKVATAGSFLIDAETRLTGGLGSTYFGASAGPQSDTHSGTVRPSMSGDEGAKIQAALARLDPGDRKLAEAQKLCPILKSRLGSMGKPIKLILNGETVFLCCKGCEKEAKDHPDQTVQTVRQLRGERLPAPVPSAASSTTISAAEAKISANLAKLSTEDRKIAESQRFCAVLQKNRLGKMGVPIKLTIQGRPVFLCCEACEDQAREQPEATLRAADRLHTANRAQTPP
jgi:membrane fusion protein, copper/silver efflux system